MYIGCQGWNQKQALLRQELKENNIEEAKIILQQLHSIVHTSEVYGTKSHSFMDEIWENLSEKAFRTMPSIDDVTIAWNIWHISRIEDLTSNILIANSEQILNDVWVKRLNISIRDTGNAMSKEEIVAFSSIVNLDELKQYRNSVGIRTIEIIKNINREDLKRKFTQLQLNRILTEGGLIEHPQSIWLLDFWGKKSVAGIILMPITRHQIVHLNDCNKLKRKSNKM